MTTQRRTRWKLVVSTVAAVAAVGGCKKDQTATNQQAQQGTPLLDTLTSCPHYWSRLGRVGDTLAPMASGNVDVPEYNDCQRLVHSGGGAYGPLPVPVAGRRLLERAHGPGVRSGVSVLDAI
jgi:hypothetical protein